MEILEEIKKIVLPQGKEIIFSDPVVIKRSPHQHIFNAYAVHAEESGVWLLDERGEWHQLEQADYNAELVANSIYQRLKIMELQPA